MVPPHPDSGSSGCAPATTTFSLRFVPPSSSIVLTNGSPPPNDATRREERPNMSRRVIFSIFHSCFHELRESRQEKSLGSISMTLSLARHFHRVSYTFRRGGKGYADAVAFHGYPPCCSTPYPPEDILNILAPCLEP